MKCSYNLPRYQAPTHFGSDGPKPGLDKSTYILVQNDPNIKPAAGPKMRTPIVMAEIYTYVNSFVFSFYGNKIMNHGVIQLISICTHKSKPISKIYNLSETFLVLHIS